MRLQREHYTVAFRAENQPHDLAAHGVGDRKNPALDAAWRKPHFLTAGAPRVLGVEPETIKKDARGSSKGKPRLAMLSAALA